MIASHIDTSANQHDRPGLRYWQRRRRPTAAVIAVLLGFAVLAAGCGGGDEASGDGAAGSSGSVAQLESYAKCMRSHGISDFPDPSADSGGQGGSFKLSGHGDLDPGNPAFKAAQQSCRSLLPGGSQPPAKSSKEIAAEVKWAQCLRSHGLPSFPDPNGQGAFDSSKFDENTPAFQTANKSCQSLMNGAGSVSAVPGHGSQ